MNGKAIALNGDTTTESDSYANGGSGDGGGTGSVTSGNGSRVIAQGKSVAIIGSTVRTHAGSSTTISTGSSNVKVG